MYAVHPDLSLALAAGLCDHHRTIIVNVTLLPVVLLLAVAVPYLRGAI